MDSLFHYFNIAEKTIHPVSFSHLTILIIAIAIGWMLGRVSAIRKIATLETMLQLEMESAEQKLDAMQQSFASLSGEALQQNNRAFLDLAEQSFSKLHQQADHQLQSRQQAIEHIIKPLKDSLTRNEKQIEQLERQRIAGQQSLTDQLTMVSRQHIQLESETRNLVKALRRPEIRGQWGEISLKRLVELSGMSSHCDFSTQVAADNNRLRPDMVVYLPGNRQIVVDVKTPMDAYLNAIESTEEQEATQYLKNHALHVKKRIDELSAKSYWAAFDASPEFVILFIPGEQFLSAALEQTPSLIEYALKQRIILATPTSLVALLRTIAHGWTQEKLNTHALEIRQSAQEYHQRLATFSEHLQLLGKQLEKVVDSYNQSVGSYDRKLLPIAKQFSELGLKKDKDAVSPEEITTTPRTWK